MHCSYIEIWCGSRMNRSIVLLNGASYHLQWRRLAHDSLPSSSTTHCKQSHPLWKSHSFQKRDTMTILPNVRKLFFHTIIFA